MSNDFKKKQAIKMDYEELAIPIMTFAIVSPFLGYFMVNFFGISFDTVGTYGDFIGGSTVPFLTSVTLLFIYQTYKLQSEQLRIQKGEYSLLQKEMEITKEALLDQSQTTKMQRFENSFSIQIKELRDIKTALVDEYIKNRHKMTYKLIMLNFQNRFYEKLKHKIEINIDYLLSIDVKINQKEYYEFYSNLVSAAIDESGIRDKEKIQDFLYLINRCLELIYHYKNNMDVWERTFYLESLYHEITSDAINLVLFDLCLHGPNKAIIRELQFNNFADTTRCISKDDFLMINYILNQELI